MAKLEPFFELTKGRVGEKRGRRPRRTRKHEEPGKTCGPPFESRRTRKPNTERRDLDREREPRKN